MRGRRFLCTLPLLVLTVKAAHGSLGHAPQPGGPRRDSPSPREMPHDVAGRPKKTSGRSSRVPIDTSLPFSAAPQPVRDTPEVALARKHFMLVFERIKASLSAPDREAKPVGESPAGRGPPGPFTRENRTSPFPDPVTEPEYFLPSVHVDPGLLQQLHPPLPPDPYIQEMRLLGEYDDGGVCYEFIILEPEPDDHNGHDDACSDGSSDGSSSDSSDGSSDSSSDGSSNGSSSDSSNGSSDGSSDGSSSDSSNGSSNGSSEESSAQLEDSAPSKFVGIPRQENSPTLQASRAAPANKSARAHIHQAQDVHGTDPVNRKSVPSHFKAPMLSFLSTFRG